MSITIIPADGPTFSEAFTDQFGRSYDSAANRYQSEKATRIQEALHRDQLAQQKKQFDESQARLKAQDAAMEQYRQENLQRERENDAAKRRQTDLQRQQADDARSAQAGYVQKYGTDADRAYFAAFGKLPASHDPARHTTAAGAGADPEAKKITVQLGALDDQYKYWSAQKKDAENTGEKDPDASDTEQRAKKGKEEQYRSAVKNMMAIEGMQAPLRRRAFEIAGGTLPGAGPAAPDATNPAGINPFQTTAAQSAPSAPIPVKIEDLNAPLPAGVLPFNPQGGIPGRATPSPAPSPAPAPMPSDSPDMAPQPEPSPAQPAPPDQPAVQFSPEQARDLLDVVAAKHGKRPALIQQLPPAPLSKVAQLKAAAIKNHSDPLKARELFYDLMILSGFNPLAQPLPDEQQQARYQVNPGGQVDVRVLE